MLKTKQQEIPEYLFEVFDLVLVIDSNGIVTVCRGLESEDNVVGNNITDHFGFVKRGKEVEIDALMNDGDRGEVFMFAKKDSEIAFKGNLILDADFGRYLFLGKKRISYSKNQNLDSRCFLDFPKKCFLRVNGEVCDLYQCNVAEQASIGESFFLDLFEKLPFGVTVYSKDHEILFANERSVLSFNTEQQSHFKNKNGADINEPKGFNLSDKKKLQLERAATCNEVIQTIECHLSKYGLVYEQLMAVPKFNVAGDLLFVLWINIDVSKEIEQEFFLRQSVDLAFEYFNSNEIPIVEFNNEGEILSRNSSFFSFCLSKQEAKTIGELLPSDEYLVFKKKVEKTVPTDADATGLFKIVVDGQEKFIRYQIFKKNYNNTNFCIFKDVTGLVLADGALLNILEEKNLIDIEKSKFVNDFTHEIRNPLAVILSSAEILGLQLKQQDLNWEIQKTKSLGEIKSQVRIIASHMDRLIEMFKQ